MTRRVRRNHSPAFKAKCRRGWNVAAKSIGVCHPSFEWPCGVVVELPPQERGSGLGQAGEQRLIEKLVAHATVEALGEAVLHRLSQRDEVPVDTAVAAPGEHGVPRGRRRCPINSNMTGRSDRSKRSHRRHKGFHVQQLSVPVIICGGAGSRLWPASRESFPKQFIALLGEQSMFQKTLSRVGGPLFSEPVIVTHADFRFLVASQLMQMGMQATILLEPARRESGPAIAAAAAFVEARSPGARIIVLPSDHLVLDEVSFLSAVTTAATAADEGRIVTFGMIPDHPATGYGYIQPGKASVTGVKAVARFVEKPDAATAQRYINEGYLWNSGMFMFASDVLLTELSKFEPEIVNAARGSVIKAEQDISFIKLDAKSFEQAPKKSIDYALMERTKLASVVPASFGWSDVGNWSSVHDASPKDEAGNAARGEVAVLDSRNNYVQTDGPLTVLIGVDDLVVIVENDAVMVAHRDRAEAVKGAFERLKATGHRSVTSSLRVYRPWGYYQTLDLGSRFQVKRILVDPGQKLSLQSHHHRAEHWVVVQGTAVVTRDKDEILLRENESVYLPLGCLHRLSNPGKIPLEIVEVQSGSYLGEDDIVRYEDDYRRA